MRMNDTSCRRSDLSISSPHFSIDFKSLFFVKKR